MRSSSARARAWCFTAAAAAAFQRKTERGVERARSRFDVIRFFPTKSGLLFSRGVHFAMVAKTKTMKRNAKTKGVQKSSSNAALAAKTASLKKKKKKKKHEEHEEEKYTKRRETKLEQVQNDALRRRRHAKNTSSSVFERSVANFPKFDPEAGSSVYGVSSLSRKDHKRWMLDLRSDWRFFHVVSFVVNFSDVVTAERSNRRSWNEVCFSRRSVRS